MKRRLASLLATAGLVAGMAFVSTGVPAAAAESTATSPDSVGTNFWLAFPGNVPTPTLTLLITGSTATAGTVAAPGVAFSTPFTVTPGTVTSVSVPDTLDIQSSEAVESLGIHVTAGEEVAVYGLNQRVFSTDGYLGLPADVLGTDYVVEGFQSVGSFNGSEFVVVAAQDATTVTINPTVTTIAHAAGTPYTVALDQGQTYQLRGDASGSDVSGSIVTADKPIAVFGGHQCAQIDGASCNHVVEQMTPTGTWGMDFVTQPFATRTGDTFRYLARTNDTHVSVNGSPVATLNRGQFFEQTLTAASVVTSDKLILVTQYMTDGVFPGTPVIPGDPSEVVVPPVDEFLTSYTVATPASGFSSNFINVVAPTASLASVTLDGVAVPGASFSPIPGSSFSGAQLAVAGGFHSLVGSQPLGAIVYGLANGDGYGYPAGMSFPSLIPPVTHLTLTKSIDNTGGGTADATDWTLSASGPRLISGTTGSPDVTDVVVDPGTYTLAESGPAGYSASAWSCDGGTLTGDSLVLAAGDDASCSITNTFVIVDDGTISALGDVHGWIGLKNGDDQGTKFDLRVELLKNGDPVATGIQRCITVVRNPLFATEAIVPWNAFAPVPVSSGDVVAVRLSARIGTGWGAATCNGHSSAIGARFYYDAGNRNSRFDATITPNPSVSYYLHSDGAACNDTESRWVANRWLSTTVPLAAWAKCKDSGVVNVAGGNKWSTIGTWSLAPLP